MAQLAGILRCSYPHGALQARRTTLISSSDLFSGKFHDLIIKCKGKEWQTHRIIVCTISKFFDRACQESFQVDRSSLLIQPLYHLFFNY